MYSDDEDAARAYVVLINEEEQYSLWLSHKAIPDGWKTTGVSGTKAECVEYVDNVWKDITPLSVRQRLAKESEVVDRTWRPDDATAN
jgi:MbtH protein